MGERAKGADDRGPDRVDRPGLSGRGTTPDALADLLQSVADSAHVSPAELLDALGPVLVGVARTRRRAVNSIDEMVRTLTPTLAGFDPVPRAALTQIRRRAALHTKLLAGGAYTYAALAEGRGASDSATRQWVKRARDKNQIFTVTHNTETLVPAFLLDDHLKPRRHCNGAIEALRAVGDDGWSLWAWFATPSAWLDGAVPAEVAETDPERVTTAARRAASNAA